MVPANYAMLLAGRFISGIGVGGLSMAATLYQAETAPSAVGRARRGSSLSVLLSSYLLPFICSLVITQVRGLVVSIQQLSITFGILLAGALNVCLQVPTYLPTWIQQERNDDCLLDWLTVSVTHITLHYSIGRKAGVFPMVGKVSSPSYWCLSCFIYPSLLDGWLHKEEMKR